VMVNDGGEKSCCAACSLCAAMVRFGLFGNNNNNDNNDIRGSKVVSSFQRLREWLNDTQTKLMS
jgi:hypothetical protein